MTEFNHEANIILALQAMQNDPSLTIQNAALDFNVSSETLYNRRNGVQALNNNPPNSRRLFDAEENDLILFIFAMESRGFFPQLHIIEEKANQLLAARGAAPVSKCWSANFVKRHTDVQMSIIHRYEIERASPDNIFFIRDWFKLVQKQVTEHEIHPSDIYNFDETGFIIGSGTSARAFTGAERYKKSKSLQPNFLEWATAIQAVNSTGWVVPPFIVVAGQSLLDKWRLDSEIPADWAVSVTQTGLNDRSTSLKWLSHFDHHTKTRKHGTHRLLILARDELEHSCKFEDYCKENNIITICTPPNSSHLLQPLNTGCHELLKASYKEEMGKLPRSSIFRITKTDFLLAFHAAHKAVMKEDVIKEAFKKVGLVPWNPDAVFSTLNVDEQLANSTGKKSSMVLKAIGPFLQMENLRSEISRGQNSSPSSVFGALGLLVTETRAFIEDVVSMRAELDRKKVPGGGSDSQQNGEGANSQQSGEVVTVDEETDGVDIDMQMSE